jgi:undecaprenyl-diphosphatase
MGLEHYTTQLLFWIQAYPLLAYLCIFLIAISESLVIIGLVIPGIALMSIIGALVGTGHLNLYSTLTAAILGAIVGDGISYIVGRVFKTQLRNWWIFRHFPELILRCEQFFEHHGGKSIIFGRFVGPVRPMIPAIAGMLNMKPAYFFYVNILSAAVWAPVYLLPGILFGNSLQNLPEGVGKKFIILAALFFCACWAGIRTLQKTTQYIQHFIQSISVKISIWISKHLKRDHDTQMITLFILALITFTLFALLTYQIQQQGSITEINFWAQQVFSMLYLPWIEKLAIVITMIGDKWNSGLAFIVVWLFALKRGAAAFCWHSGILMLAYCGLNILLQQCTGYPSPIYSTQASGYPNLDLGLGILTSGYLALYFSIQIHTPRTRLIARHLPKVLLTFWTAVGLSQLYIFSHWILDSIGGLLLSLLFLLVAGATFGTLLPLTEGQQAVSKAKPPLKPNPSFLIKLFVTTFYLSGLIYIPFNYDHKVSLFDTNPTQNLISVSTWWTQKEIHTSLYERALLWQVQPLLNVEWQSDLATIQTLLQKQGFQILPRFHLKHLGYFLKENPDPLELTLLPQFYQQKTPTVIYAKRLNPTNNTLLTLSLWEAPLQLEHTTPLWIGAARLYQPKHDFDFFTYLSPIPQTQRYAIEQLRDTVDHRMRTKLLENYSPEKEVDSRLKRVTLKRNHTKRTLLLIREPEKASDTSSSFK